MRRHVRLFTTPASARRLAVQTLAFLALTAALALAFLALTAALAPVASAEGQSAQRIASQAGDVSEKAARVAVAAAERVEREMRREGALESSVLGCWRQGAAVDCTGVVKGNDGWIKWRCVIKIRIQKRRSALKPKLTDADCIAEDAAESEEPRAGRIS